MAAAPKIATVRRQWDNALDAKVAPEDWQFIIGGK